jgi:hypothetical protein
VVCKYGPSTRLTFGVCNRYPCFTWKKETKYPQLVIYGWRGSGKRAPFAFSRAGVSGAGIVTLDGRLIGILRSGDEDESVDATYAMPWEVLQEDFRAQGLTVTLC